MVLPRSGWIRATPTLHRLGARHLPRPAPYLGTTRYVNYLDRDEPTNRGVGLRAELRRLREIKRTYDPENVFHMNVNIRPI